MTWRRSVITFVGVAACSMIVTVFVLTNIRPHVGSAPKQLAATKSDQDVTFDIQRDQVYAAGLDLTDGVPVISTPKDVRH